MSSTKKIAEFPDVEAKLQKPAKQSAFERQRAEAEAKRQREAAETAAVYEDFVKSFDQGGDGNGHDDGRHGYNSSGPRYGGDQRPGGKRHFGMSTSGPGMKSGPGSLGPPPPAFGKKRHFDGAPSSHGRERDESRGRLGFDEHDSGRNTISKAFNASDDEDETTPSTGGRAAKKAISRPTLRLANLPPTTSPAVIKSLIPSSLTIENIRIVPPAGPAGTERKSTTAIVTLSKETPASDIEAAVSTLQNRYLGYGFYLNLHRHLSSAAISSTSLPTVTTTAAISHPFGAKRVAEPLGNQPPHHHGRYAPPPSYAVPVGPRSGILHVPIQPPRDIKKLRMIHKVLEAVLLHGPEFEALLMSRPEVQRDEKWGWIWDARSEGGIWYRWRLWEIVTGGQQAGQGKYLPLFEGSHAWKMPEQGLAYEYITGVSGFVDEEEYNSSDEEDFEDEREQQQQQQKEMGGGTGTNEAEDMFLNPIAKSKLAHLLARLPTSLSKVRKGDVARVAAFAITRASKGSDEIVDMIVDNVEWPFAYTSANPGWKGGGDERHGSPGGNDKGETVDAVDVSAARLIGLYVISDILSSSSTSGVRHAWRYRQLFETALRSRKVFEMLGSMAEKQNWGRLRAEKWKRSVGLVLGLWEGWCVFPAETQEVFVRSFENPPQVVKKDEKEEEEELEKKVAANGGRWKTVAEKPAPLPVSMKPESTEGEEEDDDGERDMTLETGDTDGEIAYSFGGWWSDEEGGESDGDIDGEPVGVVEGPRKRVGGRPDGEAPDGKAEVKAVAGFQMSAAVKAGPAPVRKRMRAVDMFADSGSEEGD